VPSACQKPYETKRAPKGCAQENGVYEDISISLGRGRGKRDPSGVSWTSSVTTTRGLLLVLTILYFLACLQGRIGSRLQRTEIVIELSQEEISKGFF